MKYLYSLFVLFLLSLSTQALANREVECLAKIGYFEARGEPLAGQHAVMHVTLNRVKHREYPNTVCGNLVPSQYQWLKNRPRVRDWQAFNRIRQEASLLYAQHLMGQRRDNTGGAYFFSSNGVRPAPRAFKIRRIGRHDFYGLRPRRT